MGLVDCLVNVGLGEIKADAEARIKVLTDKGINDTEANAIVKREIINEQYKQANDELNKLKKELKLPQSKFTPLSKIDLTEVNSKYEESKNTIPEYEETKRTEVVNTQTKASDTNAAVNQVSQQASQTENPNPQVTVTTTTVEPNGKNETANPKEKAISEKAKSLADKIRKGKIGNDINMAGVPFLKEIWNEALEVMATTVELTGDIAQGIKDGIEYIKNTTWYKGLSDENKQKAEDLFESEQSYLLEEGTGTKDGEFVGITHEQTTAVAMELGFQPYEESPETIEGWDNKAEEMIKAGYNIEGLLTKMEEGKQPDKIEQRIIAKYIAYLKDKVNKDSSDENLSKLKRAIEISDIVGGREVAKSLVARRGIQAVDDSLAGYFIREMEASVVDVLTTEQKNVVRAEYEKIQAANEELLKKVDELKEENARIKAGEVISEERKTQRKGRKTADDFNKERISIKESIQDKLKKARSESSVVVIPYAKELFAIAPDVAKLVRNLAEQGVTTLAEMVDNIHEFLKDEINGISKNDVQDLIAGNYNAPRATKSELTARLKDLRDEAKLLSEIDRLESSGELKNTKAKVERNQRITALNKQLKVIQDRIKKGLPRDEVKELSVQKKRTQQQIEKVEEQLKTGEFTKEKPVPLKLDKEGKDLQDKLIKLKQDREIRLLKAQYDSRSRYEKARDKVLNYLNVPRTIMASMDYSAPLRQGIIATTGYPLIAKEAAAAMFKSSFSQKEFDRWFYELKESPRYELIKETKLAVTDPHSPFLTAQEEAYMGNVAEKIPIVGKLIKGSERAYVMYLNKMRVDIFNRFADRFEQKGKTYENSKELYEQLAKYVNNITGRGHLGKLENYAPVLNTLLFSPRLIASRLNILNPIYFAKLPRELKIAYAKDMASFIGTGMTVLGLSLLAGALVSGDDDEEDKLTVEKDPRSSDFGKIKQGNTRWDVWGGFQPYIRVFTQVLTGERKSSTSGNISELDGDGPFGTDRADVILSFVRGKLAPVPSAAVNFFSGKTVIGEPVTVKDQATSSLLPLLVTSLSESLKDQGVKALFTVAVPSIFGVGTQTYEKRETKGNNINVYISGKKRQATELEQKKYEKLKSENKIKLLIDYQKKGVYIDKYGDITTDYSKKTQSKKYDNLTGDEKTKLDGIISTKAARVSKEKLGFDKD